MKCTIDKDGQMRIAAETPLEAFALSKFAEIERDGKHNIVFDWSLKDGQGGAA